MQQASLREAFERALGAILARVCVSGDPPVLAVACSGGLDSMVLLDLARRHAGEAGLRMLALHVHHGLSPNADLWQQHVERECARHGVPVHAAQVTVPREGDGIEQGARLQRYRALGELCREHGARLLLTAHHLDDQAETVLLQLLRGAGVAGMGAMEAVSSAPGLLGDAGIALARPLLGVTRAALEAYARECGLAWIDDESNRDPRFARNALRHAVMPALAAHFPGYQARLARAADHARAAQRLLDEIAAEDLARCLEGESLRLDRLDELGPERASNVVRHWFARRGMRMPSTAWLEQMLTQVGAAREDARVRVEHPDGEIHRHRGRLFLVPCIEDAMLDAAPVPFRWQGEEVLHFPSYRGSLRFAVEGEAGRRWLASQPLELRRRQGGETLKLAANRPARSLKQHFQALDVPAWERRILPLVTADGKLLFAAGIGMNRAVTPEEAGISLKWEPDRR
ncbi:tRNA lysidine(34) synthetase TilS [Noviherbaspirillum aridicola]|nr:tRNA lysidine(34) synthetase TilS [Noviherbaspirillum aridicola]